MLLWSVWLNCPSLLRFTVWAFQLVESFKTTKQPKQVKKSIVKIISKRARVSKNFFIVNISMMLFLPFRLFFSVKFPLERKEEITLFCMEYSAVASSSQYTHTQFWPQGAFQQLWKDTKIILQLLSLYFNKLMLLEQSKQWKMARLKLSKNSSNQQILHDLFTFINHIKIFR